MSQKIDPREVLSYLNQLGYTNINSQQLKEFMRDLKKLIKYEHKYQKENTENVNPSSISSFCNAQCTNNKSPTRENERSVFNFLYNQPTVASKAKEVPKERQISVHISKRNKIPDHDHCIHVEKQFKSATHCTCTKNQLEFVQRDEVQSEGSYLNVGTESTIKSIRPSSKQSVSSAPCSSKFKRPKSVFLRPASSKPINKCDPVALYHRYQTEWKKQKFPGQDSHSDLRWSVRAKMLSGPKVDIPRTKLTCKKRCNSANG